MLPVPASSIDDEIHAFDTEPSTALAEASISALIAAFRQNHAMNHVLLKVVAINRLYRARVLDMDMENLARHVVEIDSLDTLIASGAPEAVPLICDCTTVQRKYYSFATKFCSWHNQSAYSIWDGNVDVALWAYKQQDSFADFKRGSLRNYNAFLRTAKAFRSYYGLENYSLKSIDKFLWQVGGRLTVAP